MDIRDSCLKVIISRLLKGKTSVFHLCVSSLWVSFIAHTKHFWPPDVWRFFPPHQVILCDTNWVSYNLTPFWHYLPEIVWDPTHKGSVQMPIISPGCHLCFWPGSYTLEVLVTLSLDLINLLERLTELGKHLTFMSSFKDIIKDTDE